MLAQELELRYVVERDHDRFRTPVPGTVQCTVLVLSWTIIIGPSVLYGRKKSR